jgi:hypothetical protein
MMAITGAKWKAFSYRNVNGLCNKAGVRPVWFIIMETYDAPSSDLFGYITLLAKPSV